MVKNLAYAAGLVLFLAGAVFVATFVIKNWDSVSSVEISLLPLIASIALYALSHITTGFAWPLILKVMGERVSVGALFRIGLLSQIGKYLPGNVAHFIGRAGLSATSGVAVRKSGLATALEVLSVVLAALLVSALALVVDPAPVAFVSGAIITAQSAVVVVIIAVAAGVIAASIWLARRGQHISSMAVPVVCFMASFVLSGASFHALLWGLGQSASSVIGVYAVIWTIGFVIPGAPAGLGVREALLIAFLAPAIGAGPAAAYSILHRVMTACVDAGMAGVGLVWTLHLEKRAWRRAPKPDCD